MSVLAYERRRIRSIRSTWFTIAVVVLLGALTALLFVTVAAGSGPDGQPTTDTRTVYSVLYGPLVVVPLSVLAAMAFGGEYKFGLIRLTLTTFPKRSVVLFAKLGVVLAWMLGTLLATWAFAMVLGFAFADNITWEPFNPGNLAFATRAMLLALAYGVFVFALVVITRSQALGLTLMLVWLLVIEGILGSFLSGDGGWLRYAMPMTQGAEFVASGSLVGLGILLAWLVFAVTTAWILLLRRDA